MKWHIDAVRLSRTSRLSVLSAIKQQYLLVTYEYHNKVPKMQGTLNEFWNAMRAEGSEKKKLEGLAQELREYLVHEASAVDGDFPAHAPVGMLDGICHSDGLELLHRPLPEGTSAGCQDDAP